MLPKIPTIKFVVTRPNPNSTLPDREEFDSVYEFEQWAIDEDYENFKDAYHTALSDGDGGYEDLNDFVHQSMDLDHVIEIIESKGWKFYRIPMDDKSNEKVKGM